MSQSQQRHGASPGKQGGKDVGQLLARASDLETRLSNYASTNTSNAADDSVAQGYRLKVCEVLSDVLLTDPAAALKNDVPGRLWRVCFYNRIGELRGKIQRETVRLQRLKKAAAGNHNGNVPTSTEKKDTLEAALRTFLGEAIVLYDYLVDRYEGTLKKNRGAGAGDAGGGRQGRRPPSQSKEPASTGSGGGDENEEEDEEDPVVVILYRLLIHRGDLHRYAANFAKSESSYLASSRLRPGMGNPYNQLAVVSQQHREQTVVALYYYARSLCAAVEPFEPTSRTNLRRLFVGNAAWYAANRDTLSDVYRLMLSETSTSASAPGGGEGGIGAQVADRWTGGGRLAKSGEKTRVMKLALAAFVDLHGSLFLAAATPSGGAAAGGAVPDASSIGPTMDSVLSQFRILLSEHCLSDALVTKMVVINAFAVANCGGDSSGVDEGEDCRRRRLVASMALRLAVRFGVILLEQMGRNLERAGAAQAKKRALEQRGGDDATPPAARGQKSPAGGGGGGGGVGNVRLLGPVVLLADWLHVLQPPLLTAGGDDEGIDGTADSPGGDGGGLAAPPLAELLDGLHSKLCDTWNALAEVNPPPPAYDGDGDAGAGGRILKEHVLVRGFRPFAPFVDQRRGASTTASGEEEYAIRMGRLSRCLVEHERCTFDATTGRFLYGVDADATMDDDGMGVAGGASLTQDEDEEEGAGGPSLAFHAGMDETQSPGLLLPPGYAGRGVGVVARDCEADADDVIVYRAPAATPPAPFAQVATGITPFDGPPAEGVGGASFPSDGGGSILRNPADASRGGAAGAGVAAASSPRPPPPPGFGAAPASPANAAGLAGFVGGVGDVAPPPLQQQHRPPPGFVSPVGAIGGDVIGAAAVTAPAVPLGGGILPTATNNPFAYVPRDPPAVGGSAAAGGMPSDSSWAPSSSSLFQQAAFPACPGPALGAVGAVGSLSHPLGFELGGGAGVGGPPAPANPPSFDFSSLLFDHNAGSLLQGQQHTGSVGATQQPRRDPWGGGLDPGPVAAGPPAPSGGGLGGGATAEARGVDASASAGVGWMFGRPTAAGDAHGRGGMGGTTRAAAGGSRGATTNNPFFG